MDLREKSGWKFGWKAELTDAGSAACADFELPRSLVKRGKVDDWTPSYALKTLSKLASLDGETPAKKTGSVELDSVVGEEDLPESSTRESPKGETPKAETKRAKRKKL